jgi:hypothetical protein
LHGSEIGLVTDRHVDRVHEALSLVYRLRRWQDEQDELRTGCALDVDESNSFGPAGAEPSTSQITERGRRERHAGDDRKQRHGQPTGTFREKSQRQAKDRRIRGTQDVLPSVRMRSKMVEVDGASREVK